MSKPIHVKPSLYAYVFIQLKEIAKDYGYNLVIHGSMARDLDLIAIPWENELRDRDEMIRAFAECVGGTVMDKTGSGELWSPINHGRVNYIIDLNRGGYKRNESGDIVDPTEFIPDPEYYLDISVTPAIQYK